MPMTLCQAPKSNKTYFIDNGITKRLESLPMTTKETGTGEGKKSRARPSMQRRATKARAVMMLAAGEHGQAVADALGVHKSTVSRFRSRKEVKELVDQTAQRLLDVTLEPALNMYTDTILMSNQAGVSGWVQVQDRDHDGNLKVDDDDEPVMVSVYDSDYHKNQIALRKIAIAVSDSVMKTAGLLPTHMIAPRVMETVFAEGRQGLTPALQRLVGQHLQVIMVGEEEDQQEASEGLVDVAPDQPPTMPTPSTDSPPEDNPE